VVEEGDGEGEILWEGIEVVVVEVGHFSGFIFAFIEKFIFWVFEYFFIE
jgi:hypothetical protein